ncbi:MAG TPA: hypothetical protein VNK23_02515 [Candidatus Dormibacteraeota bacterium]|nr:hypothetical protein [Candidatus Dormibacteraeota bacterium]
MKSLVDLSISSGAMLIAVSSVAIVWLFGSALPAALRPVWVVVVPLGLAFSLYWLPVWLGADASEYGVWEGLVVGAWFLAGMVPSVVVLLMLRKRRAS